MDIFALIIGLWVFFVTPFFWAYIFGRKSKRLFIYFGLAFLFLVFTIKLSQILFPPLGGICFYLFSFSYLVGIIIYTQKLKKPFFLKTLFTTIGISVYFLIFIIFIEGGEIIKEDSDGGSRVYMYELKRDIQEYVMTYKEYPTYEDGISGKLERYPPQVYGTWNTGVLYGLTQKRYTTKDNPDFMVAWDKKSHGVILKWRYVVFIGRRGRSEMKMVSEGRFQKLLKEQQGRNP